MTTILVVYILSLVLVLSELVIPGFVIGTLGVLGLGGSVYWAFRTQGPLEGFALLFIAVAIVPTAIIKGMRRLSLHARVDSTAAEGAFADLMGKSGPALTPLRPTGAASLAGRRVDVVTRGEPVEKGAEVQVISVEGNRVIVQSAERRA